MVKLLTKAASHDRLQPLASLRSLVAVDNTISIKAVKWCGKKRSAQLPSAQALEVPRHIGALILVLCHT